MLTELLLLPMPLLQSSSSILEKRTRLGEAIESTLFVLEGGGVTGQASIHEGGTDTCKTLLLSPRGLCCRMLWEGAIWLLLEEDLNDLL